MNVVQKSSYMQSIYNGLEAPFVAPEGAQPVFYYALGYSILPIHYCTYLFLYNAILLVDFCDVFLYCSTN